MFASIGVGISFPFRAAFVIPGGTVGEIALGELALYENQTPSAVHDQPEIRRRLPRTAASAGFSKKLRGMQIAVLRVFQLDRIEILNLTGNMLPQERGEQIAVMIRPLEWEIEVGAQDP